MTLLFQSQSKKSWPVSRVLSRTVIHLGRPSPGTSSNLPESSAGHALGFLFGLAPSGVCPATCVTTGAVRSYRTISTLPVPKDLGGIFSVALSIGSRRPGVTWHSTLWSPDFPLPTYISIATAWPAHCEFYHKMIVCGATINTKSGINYYSMMLLLARLLRLLF